MNKTIAAVVLGLGFVSSAQADSYSQNQGNAYDQRAGNAQNQVNTYDQKGYAVVNDQDLSAKIHDKLNSGWFSKGYEQVQVQVNNGNVTLSGSVKTIADKEKVDKEVRNIEGVKSLNSQIAVQEPARDQDSKEQRQFPQDTAATPADVQLNRKIRDNVSRGWLWNSYKDVALSTANGVVTLTGNVNSADDQQKLVDEILKVEGVKSVRGNLTVKNQ